ncbi:MAG: radical SAM protein, partial [Lachnospiraceae bacterium]|nr:radical SAM protein [Lachnospiraceae bacterium]
MEIHFEIENGCLLKCRHCSSFATDQGKRMNYTTREMIAFLQIFSEKKYIFLTGGEPLLHNKFDEILFFLKKELSNVFVGAFTTGIVARQGKLCGISEKRAHNLAALGLEMCYFSIYSTQAKKHDWMTENVGSFELTLESIKRLREQNVEVKINLVITKKNQDEIGDIIEMA